ncbi:YsnF/AvaK domain-containing protein [Haematobacter missouriensis]|uniref:DUF2382 domain-containing protein n=1 Tax=Haematobacter missouriensis TaxID=366616 RepID=A0A212AWS7_9RHOB|nr:YsnF/AvaK domain-containing protein [Haematobacter missouriensis]OWJ85915.1 hypothetical protein CDV52_01760 [Haematobacter missouriensis]
MRDEELVLPLAEEHVKISVRNSVSGRVSVHLRTETVVETAEVELASTEVEVKRVAINREVDAVPETRVEGGVTIIPVVEERLVVQRRLVLTEEIHLIQRQRRDAVSVPVTLRRQRAEIIRSGGPSEASSMKEDHIMADYGNRNLTAFFDSKAEADKAKTALKALGLPESSIRVTGGEEYVGRASSDYEDRGFWESISDFFFPGDERETYAEGLRRGGYLVAVSNVPDDKHDQVLDVLEDEGAIDLDVRADEWREQGWGGETATGAATAAATGAAATAAATLSTTRGDTMPKQMAASQQASSGQMGGTVGSAPTAAAYDAARAYSDKDEEEYRATDEIIPIVEEQLRVGKRDVNLGRVRVRSYVVETPVSEEVTLHSDHVEIDRHPVDRAVKAGEDLFRERVIEAEEHAEEAVISKEARVKEEIALRRHQEEHTETVSDKVRHTEVEIEDARKELKTRSAEVVDPQDMAAIRDTKDKPVRPI